MKGAPHGPAVAALCARAKKGMSLGLERLRDVLAALGDPQRALAAVHVAGSNGKGSTCAMVESIARAAGLRTGLYTSPHLCRIAERIRLDGEPVSDAALERALARVLDAGPELTFFELLTAAAFVIFAEARVELAVVEVGLGGRLDATNVLEAPLATAITSIALEHAAILGDTLDAIAREKAGIFKRGAPVVLGPLEPEARSAAADVARACGAGPVGRVVQRPLAIGPDDVALVCREDGRVVLTPPPALGGPAIETTLALAGPHQAQNAAVAAALAWQLARRWPAMGGAIARGLAAATWPGRFEVIRRGEVTVVLDCAHNPHGALALRDALAASAFGGAPGRTTLVFGALADKPWGEMLRLLAPLAGRRYYAAPKARVAAPLDELERTAPGTQAADAGRALGLALTAARPGELVLVTGSIYLVGEVRGALLGIDCDPIIGL